MGIETAILVGMLVVTAASTYMSVSAAQDAAARQGAAISLDQQYKNRAAQMAMDRTNEEAAQQQSDIMRRASAQLGQLNAVAGDLGMGGTSMVRAISEIGGVEGTDLARVESNRKYKNDMAALQSSAAAAQAEFGLSEQQAKADNAVTSGVLSGIGSGLSIYGGYSNNQTMKSLAANKGSDSYGSRPWLNPDLQQTG